MTGTHHHPGTPMIDTHLPLEATQRGTQRTGPMTDTHQPLGILTVIGHHLITILATEGMMAMMTQLGVPLLQRIQVDSSHP